MDLASVRRMAFQYGHTEVYFNEESRVISFTINSPYGVRINVYYTTGTVGTCLDHPSSGKTQLFRRNQTLASLGLIFANPRVHTDVGYYQKKDSSFGNDHKRIRSENEVSIGPNFADKLPVPDEETALASEIALLQRRLEDYKIQHSTLKNARLLIQQRKAETLAAQKAEQERLRVAALQAQEAEKKRLREIEEERIKDLKCSKRGRYCDWRLTYTDVWLTNIINLIYLPLI